MDLCLKVCLSSSSATSDQCRENERVIEAPSFVPGAFVLVIFQAGKALSTYLGQVINIDIPVTEVMFLHVNKNSKSLFPENEDKSWVLRDQVIRVLQTPSIDNRERYSFSEDLEVTEKIWPLL